MQRSRYLDTPEGMISRYNYRKRHRRLLIKIDGIEPTSKKAMRKENKINYQKRVLDHMKSMRRRAYRGSLVLELTIITSNKQPSHIQNITKNILDLLGHPLSELNTTRKGLVYYDDNQIQALSVSVQYRQTEKTTYIEATPISAYIEDIRLARYVQNKYAEVENSISYEDNDDYITELRSLYLNEERNRIQYGNDAYNGIVQFVRRKAQEQLMGISSSSIWDIANLYGVYGISTSSNGYISNNICRIQEKLLSSNPLRIHLEELPKRDGESRAYHDAAEKAVEIFLDNYSLILQPLLTPIAIQVIIKPSANSSKRGLHDLDNVVKNYLLPQINEILKPPGDIAWTIDLHSLKSTNPRMYKRWEHIQQVLPSTTKVGITKYEVWRLPRNSRDTSRGFVSVALVFENSSSGSLFSQIDRLSAKLTEQ